MKLTALKRFSSRLPKGATFDLPERDAKVLIALGVAKESSDESETPAARPRRRYRRRDLQAEV